MGPPMTINPLASSRFGRVGFRSRRCVSTESPRARATDAISPGPSQATCWSMAQRQSGEKGGKAFNRSAPFAAILPNGRIGTPCNRLSDSGFHVVFMLKGGGNEKDQIVDHSSGIGKPRPAPPGRGVSQEEALVVGPLVKAVYNSGYCQNQKENWC